MADSDDRGGLEAFAVALQSTFRHVMTRCWHSVSAAVSAERRSRADSRTAPQHIVVCHQLVQTDHLDLACLLSGPDHDRHGLTAFVAASARIVPGVYTAALPVADQRADRDAYSGRSPEVVVGG